MCKFISQNILVGREPADRADGSASRAYHGSGF